MNAGLLESLESLLAIKRQRLSIAVSPRSREILKREVKRIKQQIEELITKGS